LSPKAKAADNRNLTAMTGEVINQRPQVNTLGAWRGHLKYWKASEKRFGAKALKPCPTGHQLPAATFIMSGFGAVSRAERRGWGTCSGMTVTPRRLGAVISAR
jgi:hypothetical protein